MNILEVDKRMKTTKSQEELDLEFRRRGLMDQFAQIDEQTRAEKSGAQP